MKYGLINYAKNNGASLVGFAGVRRFDNVPKGHRPNDFMPEARTVISMGVSLPKRLVDWEGLMSNIVRKICKHI